MKSKKKMWKNEELGKEAKTYGKHKWQFKNGGGKRNKENKGKERKINKEKQPRE